MGWSELAIFVVYEKASLRIELQVNVIDHKSKRGIQNKFL